MSHSSHKIAAIGDKDSVLVFNAVGVDIFTAETPQIADDIIEKLAKEAYGVIFITETLASQIPNTLQSFKSRPLPVILPIPSASGECAGYARENLSKDVEKAVGASIGNT